MASPLKTGKSSVNLATDGPRVSRIRRDPPPKVVVKEIDIDEVDRRDMVIGVVAFALALFVIILAVSAYKGWSPREYVVEV